MIPGIDTKLLGKAALWVAALPALSPVAYFLRLGPTVPVVPIAEAPAL